MRGGGRDPKSLRRSYATFGPFDIWEGTIPFEGIVARFGEIGMTEFVLDWSPVERLTRDVIVASWRAGSRPTRMANSRRLRNQHRAGDRHHIDKSALVDSNLALGSFETA